ncbi:hypothetical protein BpHYR1_001742 [Brachionus plicatilis]|uniref:MULE transposase domain-containing protein n=1 Tax=Brachionus plicatilis TaxID=10195 RepID=A0A3M7Q964_BRAPC|nr:hypothetical protein BpHYR1_001742 [Brachionus plicatilis]
MDLEAFKNLNLNDERQSPFLRLRNRTIPKTQAIANNDASDEIVHTSPILSNENCFCDSFSNVNNNSNQLVNYYSSSSDDSINEPYYDVNDLLSSDDNSIESVKDTSKLSIESTFEELIFSKTTKLKPKIVYSEYEYIYKKTYVTKTQHIHEMDPDVIDSKLLTCEIKERGKDTAENPRRIITDALTKLPRSANHFIATKENLTQQNSKIWCVDGTFEITPTLFYQLFMINVIESGRNIPLSKLSGCWFQLADNLLNHVQSNGLCYKYVKFLAFVPAHDIIETFEMIKDISPKNFKPILDYFEKFYIGLPMKNDTTKRAVPQYPIKLWNVYKRIVKDLPRTNNHIEAWHRSLKQDIESHPTFIKLLKHLLREQRLAEKLIDEVRVGIFGRRSNKEVQKDIAVKKLLEQYDSEQKFLFLDKLIAIYDTKKILNIVKVIKLINFL